MKTKSKLFMTGAAATLCIGAFILAAKAAVAGGGERRSREEPVQLETGVDRPVLIRHGGEQEIVVKIDLTAVPHVKGKRTPLNIAVVLDRSGSMGGKKIEQAKQAAAMLVDQLTPADVFSLVAYNSNVEVLVPATHVKDKRQLQRTIDRIHSGGRTALYSGVETGSRELEEFLSDRKINRVLLLSDGLANVGPSTNQEIAGLGRRIARNGVAVTTIGLGQDYNEDLMAALAEASDANYYYVQDVENLDEVFEQELGELQSVVARRIIVRVKVPGGVRPIGFIGRPETFEGREAKVSFSQLAGAQNRHVLLRCAVDPEIAGNLEHVVDVELEYSNELQEDAPRMVANRKVAIEYTDEVEVATGARNNEVEVEWKILENALETEKAIALSDKGDYEEAKRTVLCQIDALCDLKEKAPAAQQAAIQREIELLESNKNEFRNDGLSKDGRKVLQWNSYQQRNSKAIEKR